MNRRLPACPELPSLARLKAPSNSFTKLDEIVLAQIEKNGLAPAGITLVKKSGLQGAVPYARQSVYVAGIRAWKQAREWSISKEKIRASVARRTALVERIKADTRELAAIGQLHREASSKRIAADPVLLMAASRDEIVAEALERSAEWIELTFDDLDFASDHWRNVDIGRRDPLTDYFIETLATLWRVLFGEQPATASTGPLRGFRKRGMGAVGVE